MPKAKIARGTPLVVAPPPPTAVLPGGLALSEQPRATKRPAARGSAAGRRDPRGKATREEVRKSTARHFASRQSERPPERSRQPRQPAPAPRKKA